MRQPKFKQRKQFSLTDKKLEKKHYRIIIGLMIFGVAYFLFFDTKTIGHDIRYSLYIFWLPTIIGMLTLGIYRKKFLINRFANNSGIAMYTFMTLFYLFQGLLFSYLSFGQVAKMSWDYCNYKTVEQNSEEIIVCPITRFWLHKEPCIDFKFKNRHESFKVSYSTIKDFKDKNEQEYALRINATKGIWNYYTVNSWKIVKK